MILKDNLEFHASELLPLPGTGGVQLIRMPVELGNTLNERARHVVRDSTGCEIRFVTDAPRVYLYLSAMQPEFGNEFLDVRICRGNLIQETKHLYMRGVTRLVIDRPGVFNEVNHNALRKGPGIGFSPDVIRIVPSRGGLIYCGIDTFGHAVRPPKPEEKPAKLCFCYGSSITNSHFDGYPAIMAQRLGLDYVNMGLSGACHMEPQIADWMAGQEWDLCTLELGINALWMEEDEFEKRCDYFLSRILRKNPEKPVFLLTIFPTLCMENVAAADTQRNRHYESFNAILRKLYEKYRSAGKLYLIEGSDVLDDMSCLGWDIVHPVPAYGTSVMGLNLARLMKEHLQ